jgi:hypothetical protein
VGLPPGQERAFVTAVQVRLSGRRADLDQVRQHLHQLERAPALDVDNGMSPTVLSRLSVALMEGRCTDARADAQLLLMAATAARDRAAAAWVHRPGVIAGLAWGDLDLARRHVALALEHARASRSAPDEGSPRCMAALIDAVSGAWDSALEQGAEVVVLGERFGLPRFVVLAHVVQALVLARQGQVDGADRHLEQARAGGTWVQEDRHIVSLGVHVDALIALTVGNARGAVRLAAEHVAGAPVLPPLAHALHGEAALAAGDVSTARATAQLLRGQEPGAPYPVAIADRLLGQADQDPVLLRRAVEGFDRIGLRYDAAVARLDLAELAPEDGAATRADVEASLTALTGMRAQPAADRARRLLRGLGQRSGPIRRRQGHGPLSPREEEVVRLVTGMSNATCGR